MKRWVQHVIFDKMPKSTGVMNSEFEPYPITNNKGIERHDIDLIESLTEKVINGQPSHLLLVILHDTFGSVDCER